MYYEFNITIDYETYILLDADNVIYDSTHGVFVFDLGNNNKFTLGGNYLNLEILFRCKSHGGHIEINSGRFIVDYEYGTDADFDTHAFDIQNGFGYYDDNGKYHDF